MMMMMMTTMMNYANVVTYIKDIRRTLSNRTHYAYFGRRMVGNTACNECKAFQNAVFDNTSCYATTAHRNLSLSIKQHCIRNTEQYKVSAVNVF
jgi:hypothetical protein